MNTENIITLIKKNSYKLKQHEKLLIGSIVLKYIKDNNMSDEESKYIIEEDIRDNGIIIDLSKLPHDKLTQILLSCEETLSNK